MSRKVEYLQKKIQENEAALAAVDANLAEFTHRWGPMYKAALDWVREQLSIIQASAFSFETAMCFFIYGWMPAEKVAALSAGLQKNFAGSVVLEEIDIRTEDLERVPVVLQNPQYFKPFENFTRLLPLPSYTSFDPTPFIGLFFPLFFGLILGDAGYGLILLLILSLLINTGCQEKSIIPGCDQNSEGLFPVCHYIRSPVRRIPWEFRSHGAGHETAVH